MEADKVSLIQAKFKIVSPNYETKLIKHFGLFVGEGNHMNINVIPYSNLKVTALDDSPIKEIEFYGVTPSLQKGDMINAYIYVNMRNSYESYIIDPASELVPGISPKIKKETFKIPPMERGLASKIEKLNEVGFVLATYEGLEKDVARRLFQ